MSLKELTIEQHRNAERQKFASILMSGNISKISYLQYLINQLHCYSVLENHSKFKLPDDRLKREKNIQEDINELNNNLNIKDEELLQMLTQSSFDYVDHVKKNIQTENDFLAHIYVRYLGDLRGGQMISKKIPGQGKYYQFDNNKELASSIYRVLNDNMAEEAKIVFNFATKLFIEMYECDKSRISN